MLMSMLESTGINGQVAPEQVLEQASWGAGPAVIGALGKTVLQRRCLESLSAYVRFTWLAFPLLPWQLCGVRKAGRLSVMAAYPLDRCS